MFERQNPWRFDSNYIFPEYFRRDVFEILLDNLDNEQILGLIGSRQVGKSSLLFMLIKHLISNSVPKENIYYFNLDDYSLLNDVFDSPDNFLSFISPGRTEQTKYIFLDEVQRINNAGLFLKAIYDLKYNIKIIYSGSSQLEIKSTVKEHLVGRVRNIEIQRINLDESRNFLASTNKSLLSNHLVYGGYPAVIKANSPEEKRLILNDIYDNYVRKDIIEFLQINKPKQFNNLLVLLAGQIGNLLNIDSISKTLRIPRKEVEEYITILEQTFIIRLITPFYRNYSKEISKSPKIYFLDLGLRNLVLNRFTDIELREDKGALFENLCLLELLSKDVYKFKKYNFWRTTNQTEIDFIVENGDKLTAIETKYSGNRLPRAFQTFSNYYPEAECKLINSKSIFDI